jgi:hypothetical protein
MSHSYAEERHNEPYDEHEYDEENVDPRRRKSPAGLWWIIGGGVLSVILIYGAWSYNNGGPARLRQFNRQLQANYTSIEAPSDRALAAEVTAYTKNEHSSLPAARKALQKEVATELAFNTQVAELPFAPDAAIISDQLIQANQKRSQLIRQQAQAPTLARMRAMDRAHQAADNAVEVQLRALRSALGLPPQATH